ncbi:EDD, DegV family domain-containing protein [Streptococcus pyogenes]|uniref:EDD, DegV family domain-containing protein n=1 Tax=Streptococcus pyogenes TaxID=1314 RepID=A0A8B6J5P0_STRPY|nr:DegV family protein [Streptococcus pyogenes]VGV09953.1 EDD, DegV family domain-containing protein [Streptococcus pyogenes]VHA88765.1 EDD, DegV family domain-containing protein [Streptococcus pyogenes]VHB77052.1 EDD, DegV family domain-containing protein [Streptococcus pyogenes]VHC85169.1 EDD, DegV family domain-containing protein [Streptococcus pyogenes]VHD15397.1 EDD, DegV family domain-containing protein [Streptococcus pyogenes]
MTFTIMTDSTADLNQTWAEDHDIVLIGLTILCDGEVYETVGPNRISSDHLLKKMKAGSHPQTSQINVGEFEKVFREHARNNKALLYLAFSSVLSGTYQSALMARDLVREDYPDAVIEIVDTLAAAGGEGYLTILAAEARDSGKNLLETKDIVEAVIPRLRTYFLVDDLFHLMRGGRLSKGSAFLGSLASIKPLLWIDEEGKLVPIAKIRGRQKAIKEMVAQVEKDIADSTVIVSYTSDQGSAEKLREELLAHENISDVLMMPLGPVISAHVGPNTLAVFVIGQNSR